MKMKNVLIKNVYETWQYAESRKKEREN